MLTNQKLRDKLSKINADSNKREFYAPKLDRIFSFLRNNNSFKTAAAKEEGSGENKRIANQEIKIRFRNNSS